jgi:hypothetical protein
MLICCAKVISLSWQPGMVRFRLREDIGSPVKSLSINIVMSDGMFCA